MKTGNNISSKGLLLTLFFLCFFLSAMTVEAAGERINYRLKWLFNTSVAGDLYADVHGIFKSEGLTVTVKAGGPERDAIKELELGHAQFGVASADQVIRARAKGAPVIVIAQLFQINPLQWIYRSSEFSANSLQDLKGKTLGITYGGNDETIMRTLLAKANIAESEVNLFSVRYDYTPFYQKKVDLWPVYRNTQGIFIGKKLQESGEDVGFLIPSKFGVKFVANSVVTSERMLQNEPETVKRFAAALLQGWEEAMNPDNRQKTVATIAEFDKDSSPELIEQQLDITRKLIKPHHDMTIGTIDINGWKQTEAIMLKQNQIPEPVSIERFLKPATDL